MFNFDAERVQAIRYRLGLTQADFARRLGVHLRTVQGWESGESTPRRGPLVKALLDAEESIASPVGGS